MREIEFRGIPMKVYGSDEAFSYHPVKDRRYVIVRTPSGVPMIDVVPNAYGGYFNFWNKVVGAVVISSEHEIPRNLEIENMDGVEAPVRLFLTRRDIAITEDEFDALTANLEAVAGV